MAHTPAYVPLLVMLALAFSVPVALLRFRRFGHPIAATTCGCSRTVGSMGGN